MAQYPSGHAVKYLLQQQLFEILFQLGLHAICDGYYREGVANFASSLERFYEFYVKFIFTKNGIAQNEIDAAWKPLTYSSERQLGAFIFNYVNERKLSPKVLDNASVAFRNSVIHKGKIPKRDEFISFGQPVLDKISPILNELKIAYTDKIRENVLLNKYEIGKKYGHTDAGICLITLVSLSSTIHTPMPIVQAAEIIRQKKCKRRTVTNYSEVRIRRISDSV